ncbi:site-specific DNA-methyltransferase [Brachybacterium sp. FME24]|uniref:DNA-methyltransferase n=1 Tax=Brachybacterium sp. FME24 TaxID=2742605 RepID=UPI001D00BEE4|nr:site-specific DNA-methyltransferase [Brachybacterium sp. FME24]
MTTIHNGDCIEVMNAMPPESVDAIVTDPPYGISFMSTKWDATPPGVQWAEACYRVLKPGGHIAAFGGTRTWHRLAVAIEDAGFEMRDSLAWLYGSGFPKSHDVGKAIDKLAGYVRGSAPDFRNGPNTNPATKGTGHYSGGYGIQDGTDTGPATPEAAQWAGHGTALKPAFEPIVLARKPLAEKTVARNVLAHGTGAINVDACRTGLKDDETAEDLQARSGGVRGFADQYVGGKSRGAPPTDMSRGRWPANVLLDQHAAGWVDEQSGHLHGSGNKADNGSGKDKDYDPSGYHISYAGRANRDYGSEGGGASRFFYSAKAPKSERPNVDGVQHPTVKPLAIMRWLIRLTTPPGGVVLDPFAGSGTTIEAALIEGFQPVGIEMETDYLPLIQHRIDRQSATLPA